MPCNGESSLPLIGNFRFSVTKTVRERRRSAFYLLENAFHAVPISVTFESEIEAMSRAGVLEQCRPIDEKHGGIEIVFLA